MSSAELAETALSMKSVTFDRDDSWTAFEVIENGELGAGNRVKLVYLIFWCCVNEGGAELRKHIKNSSIKAVVTNITTRGSSLAAKRLAACSSSITALISTPRC